MDRVEDIEAAIDRLPTEEFRPRVGRALLRSSLERCFTLLLNQSLDVRDMK